MKKQIALLATIIAVSGFSAFGQGYIYFDAVTHDVWDEFTTSGVGANDTLMDVTLLWAASGTADQLTSVGTSFGLRQGAAVDQVATNGVTSVGSANPISTITSMLSSGWNLALNVSPGASGSNTVATTTTLATGGFAYSGGAGGTQQFQIGGTTGGEVIELIAVAWNASSGSVYSTATAIGWSNPATITTGSSASDVNGLTALSADGENQFGVASVPEPTTLALAGLGGLSMLFLRRRKA